MANSIPATRHGFQTDDARLRPLADKVFARERLSLEDAVTLYQSADILELGWLAAAYAPLGARRTRLAPTPWRWTRHLLPRRLAILRRLRSFTSWADCIRICLSS